MSEIVNLNREQDACHGSKQQFASGAGQIASTPSICAQRRRTC